MSVTAGVRELAWMETCMELASLLQLNADILRRHFICELYNQGLDLRAEEVNTHTHTDSKISLNFIIKLNKMYRSRPYPK